MAGSRLKLGMAIGTLTVGLVLAASVGAQGVVGGSEMQRERPPHGYDWRPAPPAVHGFWGQRRWQRYSDDFAVRSMPASSHGDVRR